MKIFRLFNVIAIGGGGIAKLVSDLVNTRVEKPIFRGYMDPAAPTIEVHEKEGKVYYNGRWYEFEEYRSGIHGYAVIVAFRVRGGDLMEAYTDTPAHGGASSEGIRAALKRRKEDPNSGY